MADKLKIAPSKAAAAMLLAGKEPSGPGVGYPTPPVRTACAFEPLIDGIPAFKVMERAIAAAQVSVYLSMWVFNPATPVQDRTVRTTIPGATTWADLLRIAAGRGVEVRVLLTDVDPLLQPALHANNWRAFQRLVGHAGRLVGASAKLQAIVSRHDATVSVGLGSRLATALASEVVTLNKKKGGVDLAALSVRPGIWEYLDYDKKTRRVTIKPEVSLRSFPASHHQKMLTVDSVVAFCGGLDVNRGRLDTPQHSSPTAAWHDVHVRMEGPIVTDLERNFVVRWNDAAVRFDALRATMNKSGMPVTVSLHPVTPALALPSTPATVAPKGTSELQMHRTFSVDSFRVVPNTVVRDIADSYEKVIGTASNLIYIENQYLRDPRLAKWITARATSQADLEVIIVLPVAPEEVSAKTGADEITSLGLHLQHDIIEKLQTTLKSRLGVFSLVKKEPSASGHPTDAFGSPQIYVHSKILLIDDTFASIGSANANPRSFGIDTELNVGCVDPAAAKMLRLRLWGEVRGAPSTLSTWKAGTFVKHWTEIAAANEKAKPAKRSGFVVRHDITRFPGAANPLIPDDFT